MHFPKMLLFPDNVLIALCYLFYDPLGAFGIGIVNLLLLTKKCSVCFIVERKCFSVIYWTLCGLASAEGQEEFNGTFSLLPAKPFLMKQFSVNER